MDNDLKIYKNSTCVSWIRIINKYLKSSDAKYIWHFSLNEHFFLAIGFYVSTGSSEWVEAGI